MWHANFNFLDTSEIVGVACIEISDLPINMYSYLQYICNMKSLYGPTGQLENMFVVE